MPSLSFVLNSYILFFICFTNGSFKKGPLSLRSSICRNILDLVPIGKSLSQSFIGDLSPFLKKFICHSPLLIFILYLIRYKMQDIFYIFLKYFFLKIILDISKIYDTLIISLNFFLVLFFVSFDTGHKKTIDVPY